MIPTARPVVYPGECRLCKRAVPGDLERSLLDDVITPCHCDVGVHRACLDAYLRTNPSTKDGFVKCPDCDQDYTLLKCEDGYRSSELFMGVLEIVAELTVYGFLAFAIISVLGLATYAIDEDNKMCASWCQVRPIPKDECRACAPMTSYFIGVDYTYLAGVYTLGSLFGFAAIGLLALCVMSNEDGCLPYRRYNRCDVAYFDTYTSTTTTTTSGAGTTTTTTMSRTSYGGGGRRHYHRGGPSTCDICVNVQCPPPGGGGRGGGRPEECMVCCFVTIAIFAIVGVVYTSFAAIVYVWNRVEFVWERAKLRRVVGVYRVESRSTVRV